MTKQALIIIVTLSLFTNTAYGWTNRSDDGSNAEPQITDALQLQLQQSSVATGSGPIPLEQITCRAQARYALALYERQIKVHLRNLRLGLPTDPTMSHIRTRYDARLALARYRQEIVSHLRGLRGF